MTPLKKAHTIDKNSKEFMAWVRRQWKDDRGTYYLLQDIRDNVDLFFCDRQNLLKPLMAKLLKGAKEHGNPLQYTLKQIDREIENEKLDLIGWELLRRFHKFKKDV